VLPLLLASLAIQIDTNFKAGSTGAIERLSDTHFRITNAKGRALTIDLTNLLSEYNYRSGVHAVRAAGSSTIRLPITARRPALRARK
jgi:hypothetical protein